MGLRIKSPNQKKLRGGLYLCSDLRCPHSLVVGGRIFTHVAVSSSSSPLQLGQEHFVQAPPLVLGTSLSCCIGVSPIIDRRTQIHTASNDLQQRQPTSSKVAPGCFAGRNLRCGTALERCNSEEDLRKEDNNEEFDLFFTYSVKFNLI